MICKPVIGRGSSIEACLAIWESVYPHSSVYPHPSFLMAWVRYLTRPSFLLKARKRFVYFEWGDGGASSSFIRRVPLDAVIMTSSQCGWLNDIWLLRTMQRIVLLSEIPHSCYLCNLHFFLALQFGALRNCDEHFLISFVTFYRLYVWMINCENIQQIIALMKIIVTC